MSPMILFMALLSPHHMVSGAVALLSHHSAVARLSHHSAVARLSHHSAVALLSHHSAVARLSPTILLMALLSPHHVDMALQSPRLLSPHHVVSAATINPRNGGTTVNPLAGRRYCPSTILLMTLLWSHHVVTGATVTPPSG